MEVLGYLLAFLMGISLGLIGAGGSILTLPILVYCLGVAPVTATGYSLLIVGSTALIGGLRYYRKKQVDVPITVIFAVPSIITVYLTRAWLVPNIPDPFFSSAVLSVSKDMFIMLLFAILMILAAILMIRNGSKLQPHHQNDSWLRKIIVVGLEGSVVGVMTGVIGAGGGFLIIPALVLFAGLEMKVAVGSSLLIIALKSLLGFIGDLQAGIILDYSLLSLFLSCTIVGMLSGTALSKHFTAAGLKKAFGLFTLLIAVVILFEELI